MKATIATRIRNVAIFVHDGVELLDFAGPGEVFAIGNNAKGEGFRVYTVNETTEPVKSQGFLTVTPEFTFETCPKPDVIVLPGGSTGRAMRQTKVVDWVIKNLPGADAKPPSPWPSGPGGATAGG